jgi:hypothetical protein
MAQPQEITHVATEDEGNINEENIKGLRAKAKLADDAVAEAKELRKALLFAKAGIDTDTKIGKLLFLTHDGDDLEALKAEAVELGITGAPAPQQGATEAEQSQSEFRQAFSQGAAAGGAPTSTPDPMTAALTNFHEDVKNGVPRKDAGLAAIDRMMVAASNGDKRAIFDPNDWASQARSESASRA